MLPNLSAAAEWIDNALKSLAICRKWVAVLGDVFHPDTAGKESGDRRGGEPAQWADAALADLGGGKRCAIQRGGQAPGSADLGEGDGVLRIGSQPARQSLILLAGEPALLVDVPASRLSENNVPASSHGRRQTPARESSSVSPLASTKARRAQGAFQLLRRISPVEPLYLSAKDYVFA